MAYKKTYRKKTYKRKGTPWYNQKYSVGDMANAAWKGVKTLQGIINSEKHFLNSGASISPSTTAQVIHLSPVGQDDTISGRTGNSILSKSLTGQFTCVTHASATASFTRVIFLLDLQQVADTAPSISTILESDYISQLAIASLGRYKVLYNQLITNDNVQHKSQVRKINLRFQHHIRYNGTASTDIQKGGIYMVVLSNEATNTPTLAYNMRLGFYDN